MEYELEVTDNAIDKVFGIINNDDEYSPDDTYFRVIVKGKKTGDYEYGMGLEFKRDDYDSSEFFFDLEKFKMVIDEKSLKMLDGATIDYEENLSSAGFKIDNPNKPTFNKMEHDVQELLNRKINPQIKSHGGQVDVVRYEEDDSVLYIEMSGGCQGCSSSSVTLKNGVEQMIYDAFPNIDDIRDVTDHEAGENPYYE